MSMSKHEGCCGRCTDCHCKRELEKDLVKSFSDDSPLSEGEIRKMVYDTLDSIG